MSHKTINTGRVLYVSPGGNNATARVGDINRTYPTPQDARDAATDGDLIYVFPGTYTYGNQGATADYTGTSGNNNEEASLNYGMTEITYYCEPGVTIQGVQDGLSADPVPMIYEPESAVEAPCDIKVLGHGNFVTTYRLVETRYKATKVHFEFDEASAGDHGFRMEANQAAAEYLVTTEKLYVKGNKLSTVHSFFANLQYTTASSNGRSLDTRGLIHIEIDQVDANTGGSGFNNIQMLLNYDIYWKINRLTARGFDHLGFYDSNYYCEIGHGVFSSNGWWSLAGDSASNIVVKAGYISSVGAVVEINNHYGSGANINVQIDRAEASNTNSVIRYDTNAAINAVASTHGLAFNGETHIIFGGNYYASNASASVFNITGAADFADDASGGVRAKLKGAALIHTGAGTNSITADAAQNVLVESSVANLAVDAETTAVGGTLTVSANYDF